MPQHAGDGPEITGNEYISIPLIHEDGGLDGINVLHGGLAALIEWGGTEGAEPLLRPVLRVGGEAVPLSGLRWRRIDRWIPAFTASLPSGLSVTGTICAPGGYPAARGFMVRFELDNGGRAALDVAVCIAVSWRWSRRRVATARALNGPNIAALAGAGDVLTLETDGGGGPALAIAASHAVSVRAGSDPAQLTGMMADRELSRPNGAVLHAVVEQVLTVTPNRRVAATFFVGAGRERDSAVAAAVSMRRAGHDHWLQQGRLELSYILRAGQDHRWAQLLNRNLLFNRYFALGRGIDDDRLYLLRSRSPRCPAPGIFNEREALFWTVPALVLADPGLAREALLRIFDTFSERSGEFSRCIDGGAFDTGFALDQLPLYAWCLDHYIDGTGDDTVLDEPLVRQVLHESDAALFGRLHGQHMLCGSELLPSGDVADHPFTTLGNVLLRYFCEALPRLAPPNGGEEQPRLAGAGAEVAAAVWQHCVTDLDGQPVFASSADLEGATAVYDDPAASLALLPFFDFCPPDDPVWVATMEFLRSPGYPLWRDGEAAGLAARSSPDTARLAALCADLLTPLAPDALDRLLRVRLPGRLAAAAYDPASGEASEPHHAALAGFLAWSLVRAAEPAAKERPGGARRQ
jgi:uncharacterized protein